MTNLHMGNFYMTVILNQIYAGINALESGRHVIIACIARASIGNSNLYISNNSNFNVLDLVKRCLVGRVVRQLAINLKTQADTNVSPT